MSYRVFRSREEEKILGPVVCLDVIDVMDDFVGPQRPPDNLRHYNSVFRPVSFFARSVSLENVLVSVGTDRVSATPVGMLLPPESVQTPT
jgi:hypothetical protein